MDIRDKIQKLLALSQSPNENEAKLALLKARELMVRNKLSEEDLRKESDGVIHLETEVTFSKRRASWTLSLANVIADSYRCRAFSRRRRREQTRRVCLAGFPDDVEICGRVFRYALDCITSWTGGITRLNRSLYSTKELALLRDSYARGYIAGIASALRRQTQENSAEWALVASAPREVDDSVANMKSEKILNEDEIIRSVFHVGFRDGSRFTMADKLKD